MWKISQLTYLEELTINFQSLHEKSFVMLSESILTLPNLRKLSIGCKEVNPERNKVFGY
jgi:hypothetical protein